MTTPRDAPSWPAVAPSRALTTRPAGRRFAGTPGVGEHRAAPSRCVWSVPRTPRVSGGSPCIRTAARGTLHGMSSRHRYHSFVARHQIAWELAFAALAIAFVALGFAPEDAGWVEPAEWLLTGVFLAEFVSRLWAAPVRVGYARGHWIDLVALVPPVRGLRVLRLLRLLRLVRAFAGFARAVAAVDRLARHKGLIWVLAGWCGVMVITSIGL